MILVTIYKPILGVNDIDDDLQTYSGVDDINDDLQTYSGGR